MPRLILFIASLFVITTVQAEIFIQYKKEKFFDRYIFNGENQIIERNASLVSPSGITYNTKQRFIIVDDTTLEYIPFSSSPGALNYMQEICEKEGMKLAPEPRLGLESRKISMRIS